MKKLDVLTLAAVGILFVPVASGNHWTAVCSAGATFDEASVGKYQVDAAQLFFASGQIGQIVARYRITNTGVGTTSPPYTTLELGYTDNSPLGSVAVFLWEDDLCPYARGLICAFASGDDGNSCETCTFSSSTFDFEHHVYWVGVVLNRTSTAADVRANTLRLY